MSNRVDGYAYGKLAEFVDNIFCDIRPAREKLLDNYHLLFVVTPSDFKSASHQRKWAAIQKQLKGKVVNFGSERIPQERLTVRNATIERVLSSVWSIYAELQSAA